MSKPYHTSALVSIALIVPTAHGTCAGQAGPADDLFELSHGHVDHPGRRRHGRHLPHTALRVIAAVRVITVIRVIRIAFSMGISIEISF